MRSHRLALLYSNTRSVLLCQLIIVFSDRLTGLFSPPRLSCRTGSCSVYASMCAALWSAVGIPRARLWGESLNSVQTIPQCGRFSRVLKPFSVFPYWLTTMAPLFMYSKCMLDEKTFTKSRPLVRGTQRRMLTAGDEHVFRRRRRIRKTPKLSREPEEPSS